MKTLILSILLIFGLSAQNHGKPIADIYSMKEPVVDEEMYIDDIPFNTWQIAVDAIIEGDETKLAEEPYVDDIPFDTRIIASQHLTRKIENKSEESNVDDIPFDTEKVMYGELTARLTEYYKDEQNTCDLPESNFVINDEDQGDQFYMSMKIPEPGKSKIRHQKIYHNNHPVTFPAKLEIPKAEINTNALNHDIMIAPSSSL
jgi:hypothetical protein